MLKKYEQIIIHYLKSVLHTLTVENIYMTYSISGVLAFFDSGAQLILLLLDVTTQQASIEVMLIVVLESKNIG